MERDVALQGECQVGRLEDDPVLVEDDVVWIAAVVEARLHVEAEADLAADADDASDEAVPVRCCAALDRHEVLHLAYAVRCQETRDQDVRVGEVQLLRREFRLCRRDAIEAAALLVENGAEDARRIEARAAVPVDRAVGADEGDRVQVADDAVLGDRQVVRHHGAFGRRGNELGHYVRSSSVVRSLRASCWSMRYITFGFPIRKPSTPSGAT